MTPDRHRPSTIDALRHLPFRAGLGAAFAALLMLLAPTATLAIQPDQWTHTSEADFQNGEKDGTVVTNLGDVKLAIGTETLDALSDQGSVIYDLEPLDDKGVYIAAGPEARLLKKTPDEQFEVIAELPTEQAFALTTTADGRLLVALSGNSSRLAVLENGELTTLVELPEVRYIWDVLVTNDGEDEAYILATGMEGRVLRVRPELLDAEAEQNGNPGIEVLLETNQANVLSLARDEQRNRIYAGTDTEGLIYRITFNEAGEPQPFVVYDAPEPEIGALLVTEDGMLYAGTADAEQARPGRMEEAQSEPAGRPGQGEPAAPEAGDGDGAEPADPGDLPQVPPDPEPLQPDEEGDADAGADDAAPDDPDAPANVPDDAPDDGEGDENGDDAPEVPDAPEPEPQGHIAADRTSITTPRLLQNDKEGGEGEDDQPNNDGDADGGDAAEDDAPDAPPDDAASETDADADGTATAPTQEQHDQLREVIRQRLDQARDSGELQVSPGAVQQRGPTTSSAPSRTAPVQRQQRTQEGNAIYRIDDQGFVHEIFRESVMILRLVEADGRLLVATGNEGQVYSVDPDAEETSMVVDLDPQQVSTLLRGPNGGVLLGTSNPAKLMRLDRRFAGSGTFTSPVLDAAQISLWGTFKLTGEIPANTSIMIETRSGNVRDPQHGPWSEWSDAQAFMPDPDRSPLQPRDMKISAPPARFAQYRLTLTGDQQTTPVINQVQLAYVTPNMTPDIATVSAQYPQQRGNNNGAPPTVMNIEWEASDANNDALVYELEYRPAGSNRFLPIASDVQGNSHEWQTRRVPDGRYVIRVTASDRRDNPGNMARTSSRLADPVLVDNTPPVLENIQHQPADGGVELAGEAVDQFSSIASIDYVVDDAEAYQPILPDDLIFDSTREQWSVTLTDLAPGQHVVTLRVRDQRGNTTHKATMIKVE